MTKIFEVLISSIRAQTWEVEAETEEDYWKGKMIKEKFIDTHVEEIELQYDEAQCLECGYDMNIEDNTLICQHCGNSITIEEQREELRKLYKK